MTDQDCLLTDCWPLRALAWLAVAGWRRARHAIRQHIPGLPAHTQASKECQKVAQDMSAHGRQEEGQDQARALHMRCRQSARAWGLQARACLRGASPGPRAHGAVPRGTHGGAGIMAGAQGTAPGPQRWPDAICSHHLDCSWGSLRGQNRLILRAL